MGQRLSFPPYCSDPDCEGRRCEGSSRRARQSDDGEDSREGESGPARSCGGPASGEQKEGKCCDCCDCGSLGHGGPPAAPTSRNYAEMREKLRLRLTKRKEGQPRKPELSSDKENVVDHRKVEDLLQFINSPETKPVSSTRTAKRARHRQKRLKEKAHLEADAREQETPPLLEQPCPKEEAAQQPREPRAVKKKKKERGSAGCQAAQVRSQDSPATRKPFPGSPESIQSELLGERDASPDHAAEHTSHAEPGPASDSFCEQPSPADGRDSKVLFKPEKPHEPLSLLLNIMHHHTEDKNKQQITQISKLFAQQLKKPSKTTYIQPNIKNKMQSKPQVTELQSFAIPKKEEKKLTAHKTKQLNSVTKSPFRRGSFFPSEELHNALFLQDCPQTKGKSKKSKKKKSGKGNSSIDDVFLPKDVDLDNVEMDATEREVEYFKRFCLDSARQTRQRLSINWSNFSLKKATLAAQ